MIWFLTIHVIPGHHRPTTWIDRKRHSNWPTTEPINKIVKKGCAVVSKAHPSSARPNIEYRFSFSFAEKILFKTLPVEQKKCFMAFKSIIKFIIHKTDAKCNGETGIKSYHLKTIFLWACETIERKAWETSQGWANCFLFLITQLQICLEQMCLPSLFISDCNLLEGSELSLSAITVLIQEITSFKEDEPY